MKDSTYKSELGEDEIALRAQVCCRDLVRARSAYAPAWLEADFYDHTPFLRRMGGEQNVSLRGRSEERVEKNGDRRTRFTVAAPASSDRTMLHPSILFKAPNPELRQDFERINIAAGKKVFVQYNAAPSYNHQCALKLFGHQYSAPTLKEFVSGMPRISIFDQFSGQVGETCIQAAAKYKRIPIVIYGGLSSFLQPADAYQIKQMKQVYRTIEQQRPPQH